MTTATSTNRIVAGGTGDDFMTVRSLTVSGSQTDIGHALADAARASYQWTPQPADPVKARARRAWFERNWPQHHARMRGAAAALGIDPDDDLFYLDGLTGLPGGSACSAMFLPPQVTPEGHGLLGRNYDFFLTSAEELFAMLTGSTEVPAGPPMAGRPYVITSSPDEGPATTVLTMNELDGCMEGVNEHGLAVALLIADAEHTSPPLQAGPQVGLSSVQLPRFVLDTCATAEQAKRALLDAKQYDLGMPLHYLVADAAGDAFVWERGSGGDEYIVAGDGGALCVTNHLLHHHPEVAALPEDTDETLWTYRRYRTLHQRTTGTHMSDPWLRGALDEVRFDATNAGAYPIRTLWRSVLDTHQRSMSCRFYLGDHPDGGPRHSDDLVFSAAR